MSRDAALTRKKLLEAARREFAELGPAGARVDRIAARAGVSKERVYGHFGSKEALFAAVISAAMDELSGPVGRPLDDVATWVGSVYDFHRERPDLLRLLMWEALHLRDAELPGEQERGARYAVKVDALAERLGLPPGPEAAAVLLSLIGLAAWPSAMPQLTRMIVGPHAETQYAQEVVRETVVAMAERAAASMRRTPPEPPDGTA